jgi:Flp pilus assembly protein TadG
MTESLMKEKAHSSRPDNRFPHSRAFSSARPYIGREKGAIAIMTAILLPVMVAMFCLVIDIPRVYNRRAEMQTLADTAALAAAKKLDGTAQGISAALAAARTVVEDAANGPKYAYLTKIRWDNSAMTFGTSPDGSTGWKPDGTALNSPAGLVYVKVDTGALDSVYGKVDMFLAPVISSAFTSINASQITIAGKRRLYVTPLAICAMSKTAHEKRSNTAGTQYDELVEYGFRRGVSYDLMQLNPDDKLPINFQVDPVSLAGNSLANNFNSSIYEPYICSGTMAVPKVTGATVAIQSPFPIGTYYTHLNSRFDPYTGTCNVNMSPPDTNVKQYPASSVSWMSKKSLVQSAKPYTPPAPDDKKLQTVADKGPMNHPDAVDYGTLWAFSRAIPWSSFEAQGSPEPASGYTPFDATDTVWQKLYGTDSDIGTYPPTTPYLTATGSSYVQGPTTAARKPGTKYRRVLNVPLLSCPVSGSTAEVLAIAKFFMTVPADSASIHAEFGGIASDGQLGGTVEIYR